MYICYYVTKLYLQQEHVSSCKTTFEIDPIKLILSLKQNDTGNPTWNITLQKLLRTFLMASVYTKYQPVHAQIIV
jgi:hypothetical protein